MLSILPEKKFILFFNFFLCTVFYFSGIPLNQSILISIFLMINWIAGVKLWYTLNKEAHLNYFSAIGIGSTLGIILSIFSIILSKEVYNSNIGLFLPALFWAILELLTFINRNEKRQQYLKVAKSDVLSVSIALLPGILYLAKWWVETPLEWSGFRRFYTDLAFNEAIQNSVALNDSTKNLMILGGDVRYHWFTHLWNGAVTDVFDLDPFIATTRILPTVCLLSLALLTFAFAKEVKSKTIMAIFSTVLITSGVGISHLTGDFYQKSPSLLFSQAILLTFTYMLYRTSEKNVNLKQGILLTILFIAAFGSKGSSGLIILGGLLAVLLTNVIQRKIQIIIAGVFVAVLTFSTLIIYSILFKGDSSLAFGARLNWIPLALCVLLIAPGMLFSKNEFWTSRLIQFSAGTILTGIVLSFLFSNQDGSQNYFIFHVIAVTAIPSFIYVSKIYPAFNSKKIGKKENLASLFIAITSISLWTLGNLFDLKLLRGLAPVSIIVFSIFFSFLWRTPGNKKKIKENFVFFAVTSVFVASCLSSTIHVLSSEKIKSNSQRTQINNSVGLIDIAYREAGAWAKENTLTNSKWVTNRQCSSEDQNISNCETDWFYASAFTGRQFLIEGEAFLSKSNRVNLKADSRLELSIEIGLNPSEEIISQLQKYGISYLWIDKNITYGENIKKYGKIQYENQSILILRI